MDRPQGEVIRGELVPLAPSAPRARISALLVALSPLLLRLLWWWLERPRRPTPEFSGAPPSPALWERTEVRMQRRLLGRWRVHIVTTRWSGPGPRELAAPGLRLAVLKSARALLAAPNRRAANRRPSPLLPRAGDPGDQD